jgi:hypothetical protein
VGLAQHDGARGIGESHTIEGQRLEVNDCVSMPCQSGNGVSDVERFGLDIDGGLGAEAEETALFLPVMRQVFAQSQEPSRRQLDGMSTCE